MPLFTTKIYLESADQKDHQALTDELIKRSFRINASPNYLKPPKTTKPEGVSFSKQAASLEEINTEIIKAARETGKSFSFTVLKNKL